MLRCSDLNLSDNESLSIKQMRKIFCLSLVIVIPLLSVSASSGFRIKLNIEGLPDTVLFLANYLGDKTYLTDTSFLSEKGYFIFEDETPLPGGIYIVAGQNNNKLFEMLIDKEQFFSVTASLPDIFGSLRFTDSSENEIFYHYIRYSVSSQKELEKLKNLTKTLPDGSDSLEIIKAEMISIRNQDEDYREQMIKENEGTIISVILRAMTEPDPSRYEATEQGKQDSVSAYQLYKAQYWDNFDVADDRLLRTPLYHKRLETFFTKVVFQHPDSIVVEIDKFIEKAEPNAETFKYAVWYLTYKFETSMIMGFDEVFVHMVDTYYATEKAFWADSTVVRSLKQRADALRNVLIGVTAPNLIIMDTSGSFVSLHHLEAPYLVLFFYEMDCGHCKRELNELKKWLDDDTLGIKVFAVNTDTSLVKWRQFIRDNRLSFVHANATRSITPRYHDLYDISTTPTVFLLDENKKIIAKRLKIDQMIPFLQNHHQ
jgi:peroxiredoxin